MMKTGDKLSVLSPIISVFKIKNNNYLNLNFVIFSQKCGLYIGFRFLFYIFAAGFYFKQRQP